MNPFVRCKKMMLAIDKLLNSEVSVKLSDILSAILCIIFQLVALIALSITLINSGAL